MEKTQEDLILDNIDTAKNLVQSISQRLHLRPSTREECEDIAFFQLCKCASQYDATKGKFKTYFEKNARFKIWTSLKKEFLHGMSYSNNLNLQNTRQIDLDLSEIEATNDDITEAEIILDINNILTKKQRDAFTYLRQGFDNHKIAAIIGISDRAARALVQRVKDKIYIVITS